MKDEPDRSPSRDSVASRATAWKRFRRLLWSMAGVSVVVLGLAFAWLARAGTVMPWNFMLAIGLGVVLSLMLAGGLMGLLFFSDSSGRDEKIGQDPDRE